MSRLARLKAASSLQELGPLVGYTAKGLAFVIHGIPDSAKYTDFSIPKRSGGTRMISAPCDELKRLQVHIAHLLEDCVAENNQARDQRKDTLSHGFKRKRSIMTNAAQHRGRRYVFNIDLHDFFGTINFGRVWRFFEKNHGFLLNSDIARTIAQIACHNRALPQGSPLSPIISNLIGHILDIRMAGIAAKVGCYYSRYVDDLTFSTNKTKFSSSIATRNGDSTIWEASASLINQIKRCGFDINPTKTRMQYKYFRQEVTGIGVNKKVNVKPEYMRHVRAMVNSLVKKGEFSIAKNYRDENGQWIEKEAKGTEAQLRGMLSFIDSVRLFEKRRQAPGYKDSPEFQLPRDEVKDMDSHARQYRQFLLFTQFYRPQLPVLVCEGKTDNVYVRCALRKFSAKFPALMEEGEKSLDYRLGFFSYSKTADRILHLGGGTGDMCNFIAKYSMEFDGFIEMESRPPVIILIDNDSGAEPIFSAIKRTTKSKSNVDGSEPYYAIKDNLYVVPIPKINGKNTSIEDFFDKSVLEVELGGKKFSRSDKFDAATQYGKHLFAEHVIKKRQDSIDFSGFIPILERIQEVVAIHSAKALPKTA